MNWLNYNSGINKVVKMRKLNYLSVVFFLFAMCIFTGCTRKGCGKIANETQAEDSVSFVSESDSCKQTTAQDSLKKHLLGYWALDNVTWMKITEDSIYNVDCDISPATKYFVVNDSITFELGDGEFATERFWFVGDSLFIENKSGDGGVCKYERVN